MYNNYLEDILKFNKLNKKERLIFIKDRLMKMGVNPIVQSFYSCFGKGKNIYAEIGNKTQKIVLSAHYDGISIYDNNAAVITILNICHKILYEELPISIIVLFTDQEETYQQGSAYFIKETNWRGVFKNINLDGFGIGENLFAVSSIINNTNTDRDLFLTDKDEFSKANIPSISYFTALTIDFEKAKENGEIYNTFKKYNYESFFIENYDSIKINKLNEIIWQLIQQRH